MFNADVNVTALPAEVDKVGSVASSKETPWVPSENTHEEEILSPSQQSARRLSDKGKDMNLLDKFVATVEDESEDDGSVFGAPSPSASKLAPEAES
jgi:hypothetical protein